MSRKRFFRKFGWCLLGVLLICRCGGKKPDDDVDLIKQVLTKFERGINLQSQVVIDSLLLDKEKNISSQLLDSLSWGGEHIGSYIISKSFIVFKDSAEVRLRLGMRLKSVPAAEGNETNEMEKQIKLFLHKKRGNWKIKYFSMETAKE